jgi:hypothetical protein
MSNFLTNQVAACGFSISAIGWVKAESCGENSRNLKYLQKYF